MNRLLPLAQVTWFFLAGAGLFLLCSCAGKLPRTTALEPEVERSARKSMEALLAASCPESLDADLSLTWDLAPGEPALSSTVQMQAPDLLRYALLDPLGRPVFLLRADSQGFTAVDQRRATAFQGDSSSTLWRKYVPGDLSTRELLSLLQGQPARLGVRAVRAELGLRDGAIWYVLDADAGPRYYIRLDRTGAHLEELLVVSPQGELLLTLHFSGFDPEDRNPCSLPAQIEASGASFNGTARIRYQLIASRQPLPPSLFELRIPPSYTVHQLP